MCSFKAVNLNHQEYSVLSDVNNGDDDIVEADNWTDGYDSLSEEEEEQMMAELRQKFDHAEKKICRDLDDDVKKSKHNLKKNLNQLYNAIVCVRLMPKYVKKKEASKRKQR